MPSTMRRVRVGTIPRIFLICYADLKKQIIAPKRILSAGGNFRRLIGIGTIGSQKVPVSKSHRLHS